MALVQGPVVVGLDEEPVLRGPAAIARVALDVGDGAPHGVGVIEEDDPAGAAPDGVVFGPLAGFAKPRAACLL